MMRLFAALTPPEPMRRYLTTLRTGIRAAHWQRDDQLHLTLKFIGEIDEAQARDLDLALAGIRLPPVSLKLDGAGLFGSMEKPRMRWARAVPHESLLHLHDKVETLCRTIGITGADRKYTPHITLARISQGRAAAPGVAAFLDSFGALQTPEFSITDFALYSSHQTDDGPLYRVEARYQFAPASS